MAPETSIETGVDKLVKLVSKEKRIAVDDAAKQLNVDIAVVQEWADFLEQEGIIDVEYSLSKAFLVEKHISKQDLEKKGKEYDNKKEAFIRKVDSTLKKLESETADFETIKKQYYTLKDDIGDEIDAVKDEIEQLHHYEELKKSVDQDILKQKVEYQKTLDDIHQRVLSEEKRYQKILSEIHDENSKVQAERNEFSDIKREEGDLQKRIDALQEILNSVKTRLTSQSQSVETHEERLTRLRSLAEKLEDELSDKNKKEIEPLLRVSKDQEGRILRIQDEIMQKIKERRDKMVAFESESSQIMKRFEDYFDRRTKTESTLKELEKSKVEMKEELNDLIKKAKAFDLAAKGADSNNHIRELEGKFQDFDKKRTYFAQQLDKLKGIILGKNDAAKGDAPKERAPAKSTEKQAAPAKTASAKKSAVKNSVKHPVKKAKSAKSKKKR